MRKSTPNPGSHRVPVNPTPDRKPSRKASMPIGTLCTWSEISEYAGRGIRTLQRWEHDFGFPVHRPDPRNKSAVISTRKEIDEWFRTRPLLSSKSVAQFPPQSRAKDLTANAHRLEAEAKKLLSSSVQMHERLRKAMETAKRRRAS
jgi:hypothetical protein